MGKKLINFIASGFYISYIADYLSFKKGKFRGCGFLGTILAVFFYPFLPETKLGFIIFLIIFIFFSIYISENAFEDNIKDNPLIVIDEIAGYFTASFLVEKNIKNAFFVFIFFRLFDTIKPYPIKKLESIEKRGISIVIDDIVAGIYAGGLTYLINSFLL